MKTKRAVPLRKRLRLYFKKFVEDNGLTPKAIAEKVAENEKEAAQLRIRIYAYLRGENTLSVDLIENLMLAFGKTLKICVNEQNNQAS